MKQEKNIEKKAKSQTRLNKKKASPLPLPASPAGGQRRGDWEQQGSFNFRYCQPPYRAPVPTPSEGGKGGGFGKGPPGRPLSPDSACCLKPDNRPAALAGSKTLVNNEFQPFNTNTNFKFLQTFKFFIMKKQILILAFILLAVLAGKKSYGQDPNFLTPVAPATVPQVVTPTVLLCATDNEITPIPGKTYKYGVTVNPVVANGNIRWFVYNTTANPDAIITGGSVAAAAALAEPDGGTSKYLLDATDATYNKASLNTAATIDISWQSFDGTSTEILLVAYITGENCADNIQVYRIKPTFAFTLDIAGLMPDATIPATGNAKECISPVLSATYGGTNLTMDYGDNYIFYTVNAANFVNSWKPTFTIEANTTANALTAANVMWAYPDQAVLSTGTWNAATVPVAAKVAGGAVGANGESIIVRVYLDHANIENATVAGGRAVTLGVNGVMFDPLKAVGSEYTNLALTDLDPGAAPGPCTNTVTDKATYDLTPRPAITTDTTVGTGDKPFVTKN